MAVPPDDDRSLLSALSGDGRPLLAVTALALILSGLFALFLGITRNFLPHDVSFLGMTPDELCAFNECRIVHFMVHDRISFGGSLIGVGTLYLWLAEFPLRRRAPWAWWTFALSGLLGFASFLLYLGYGYLDTWHGVATLVLLPFFGLGLLLSHRSFESPPPISSLREPAEPIAWGTPVQLGRLLLLVTAGCLMLGGLIISFVGVTTVFVPQDLTFMGVTVEELHRINPRLVPLIAHDRAGFGGGVCCCGLTMLLCVWCGRPSRALWQALAMTGTAGFGTAIFVHPAIGYNDFVHLLPAYLGAGMFLTGMVMTRRTWTDPTVRTA